MEAELEQFRRAWIKEVKQKDVKPEDNSSKALELFDRASVAEQRGGYQLAIEYYKQAMKLDPEVEFKYRKIAHSLPQKTVKEEVEELVQVTEKLHISNKAWKQCEDSCPILDLPRELLTVIFGFAVCTRRDSILVLLLACKQFYSIFLNESIWRILCIDGYELTVTELEALLPQFDNSWKEMWINKPRIRSDGLYISKCCYKRSGWSETLTYLQPIHLVTYFRYLRLFKNFSFIFLTTPQEPSEIVPILHPRAKMKELIHGAWRWESSDVIRLEWQHHQKQSTIVCATLQVLMTSKAKFNKLKWGIFSLCS